MRVAITCMHDNPGHRWTLQELAERVGMSRSIFALKFKETVGETPMEYLTRWRMLLAGDKLKTGGDSLSESAFGKAFKRVMGCSPKQYSGSSTPRPSTPREASYEQRELTAAR
jgi:AraC-like DNA-binding protein